ncbi:MAG: glycosyltransferase family 2 protein [Candidatus Omnitrophica bacterium]|nr:glycosyltransferase family 2 protein [Candidatus Omnitrophota bacterium]MBU1128604.1 glycosyltransferase family 2 protein [Candidatus Omnitrophota bacterium]MBU1657344.1 glycosyltransferase family 2 protein [Candidatus Omnitrophota bacterium]MBU1784731.1 glycosyltransferase family 2 protein [Candidatus Omnitrophota bacterium]MBU1851546.1 glycosyltransferase family 2 protein [Candidatus Omnitrophota bacterium]
MDKNILLSVVIPAYNEEKYISSTLDEISGYLKNREFNAEVILVDDGSRDRTVEIAMSMLDKFRDLKIIESSPNRGKGYVVKRGMLKARGDIILFMDADNATSIKELDNFLPVFDAGYDAVIASRRMKGSVVEVSESPLRILLGQTYILLSRIILGSKVRDFNCGFKAYRRDPAKKIFSLQKMDDWSFDTEIIFLIDKFGMKIKEMPVRWEHKDTSKVKPLQAGIESFLSLIKIKFNDIAGIYAR